MDRNLYSSFFQFRFQYRLYLEKIWKGHFYIFYSVCRVSSITNWMVRAQKDLRLRLSFLFGWWVFSQNLSILILNKKCNPETKVLVRSIQPYLSKKCNTVHITQILYGLYIIKCTPQEIEVEFIWLLKKSNFTRLLIWTQIFQKITCHKDHRPVAWTHSC